MNGQQRFIQQSLLFQPGHRTHAVTHFHLRGFPISLLGVHVYARISFLGQLINAFEQITAYKIRPLRAKHHADAPAVITMPLIIQRQVFA